MGLLTPWILGGLLAIGLPVYLHLLRQHKNTPVAFSSLMLFERRVQSSIQHRRLKYKVLLALRVAFLALLVLAFARPVLELPYGVPATGGRTLALLLDDSFSMKQGGRFENAKTAAHAVIDSMRAQDQAQLIVFGGQTRLATDLTNDRSLLHSAVQALQAGDGASSYAEAVRAVRSLAQGVPGAVETHLFSDLQKSSMPGSFSDVALPEGTRLIVHPAAAEAIANLAVENVIAPRRVFRPAAARVLADVVSYSAKREVRRVSLWMNSRELASKTVDVPAGGRAAVEFMGVTAPYGLNRGEVRINNGDAFADDDHYNFAVERSDPAPALFIYDPAEARSLFYFQTALTSAAQPAFTLSGSSFAQAAGYDMSRQSFVVLSDPATLTRGLQSALEKYVSGGGSLFIVLGRNASGQVPLADLSLERLRSAEPGQFFSVTSVDATHPVLQATPHWDGIRVFQYVPVTPGTARVLAQLNTGDPLILERQIGAGRVMVLTSPLNRIANDLPLAPLFVPFVEQLASYLGHADTATANFTAGAFYDLRPPGASNDVPVEVTGPSGERVLSLSEATKSRSLLLEHAGFYDIRRPDGHRELVAVNPDPRESDLTLVPEETMTLWKNTGEKSVNAGSGVASPKRTQLWWYVLMAALILAVAESLAGNKHLSAKEGSHEPA